MSYRSEESDAKVVRFVKAFTAEHGFPPTTREICEAMGYESTSTGHARVKRLIRDGVLRNKSGSPRSLTVTEKGEVMVLTGGTAEL